MMGIALRAEQRAYRPFDPDLNNPTGRRIEVSASGGDYADFAFEAAALVFPNGKVGGFEMITQFEQLDLLPTDRKSIQNLLGMGNSGNHSAEEIADAVDLGTVGGALAQDLLYATGGGVIIERIEPALPQPRKARWSLAGSFVMEPVT